MADPVVAIPPAQTGTVSCADCPLRTRPAFRQFDEVELDFVKSFKTGELRIGAGSDILLAENNSAHLFTLLSGWAFRYVLLPDGQRQILNFVLPGDFIGLQAGLFEAMEHSVEALTDVTLCVFQRADLWRLFKERPSLGFDVTWLAAQEGSLVDENLVSVGQRTALARIAFLILALMERLEGIGISRRGSFEFPLTQQHIADANGLSLVHTNKTLRRLVRDGYVTIGGGKITVNRRDDLRGLCGVVDLRTPRPRPFL